MFVRRSAFWHGWRVPLCWVIALAVAWTGLFAGQPSPVTGTYTGLQLEQPSASYELLLNNVTIVDTRTGGNFGHEHSVRRRGNQGHCANGHA